MDLSVTGPKEYITLYIGDFELPLVTQTTVTLIAVTAILIAFSLAVSKRISKRPGALQVIAEKLVTMLYDLVEETMGAHNLKFAPYIGTLFASCLLGSILGMTGVLRSSTGDLSVTLAWAIVTSVMVWYNNIKQNGFLGWLKGFTEPIAVMTPMNIVSEIAQPVSMAFRHFGNVAGGSVLTSLIYSALASLSHLVFGLIFSTIPEAAIKLFPPIFQAGIPAVLSIYFDLFSGFVQAFVFCLLTMIYVGSACPPPEESAKAEDETEEMTEVAAD